jgi:hypothetical protein
VNVPMQIIRYVENAKENVAQASQPDSTERLGLSHVTVKVLKKLQTEARTEGPEVPVPGEAHLGEDDPNHEEVTVKPQWKVIKASYDDLRDIPRLNFTGCIFDSMYLLDKEKCPDALRKGEVQKFLEDFNAKTSSPAWSILIFCGFAQWNCFFEAVDSFCSGRAERAMWHKQGCNINPNRAVRFNDVEVAVLGFHMKDKAAGMDVADVRRPAWTCDFDFTDERVNRASLIRGFPVVQQMFKRDGKTVNPHQKPQALLTEMINVHMLGDDPTNTDDNGHPFNWILDACCGVGSTSMAALRAGMNVIAFDNDPFMVSSTGMRLNNFEDEPDATEETRASKKAEEEEVAAQPTEPPADMQDQTDEGQGS